ncbi:MAG TPA: hypothetical protein PLS94_03910 [Prolixibacteraceae bacterium]|nr:hypothetical protein [Prolixibacteraceae bacterium]
MNSLYNIQSIAKFERKILFRSWFFRIFSILSVFVISMFSGATFFDNNPFTWMFRSMPSSLIYSAMFLLNIFQSVIAVFLATDFLKRDKKLNTSEVLFTRPMTNFEYISGKTIALLTVFIVLNIIVIVIVSIFLFISKQVEFRLIPIVLYFVLISIPSLIFIIGLSYELMTIIKNQPVTFILLLGYIALILFYLGEKANYVFDYMVFAMPMPYSDIVGFAAPETILFQRLSYFLLGLGLIMFSTWQLNRLPNKPTSKWLIAISSLVLTSAAIAGLYMVVNQKNVAINERKEFYTNASENFDNVVPQMQKASIYIEYAEQMNARSTITLYNNHESAIDTFLFSLNPDLEVTKVESNNQQIEFEQKGLMLNVFPLNALLAKHETTITIHYSGIPNMNVAYLDNPDEEFFGIERAMTLRTDRQYGFYSKNYVLLNKEILWYPIPGIAYDPSRPAIFRQQFTNFDLTVKSKPGMLPVSQGIRTTTDSIEYRFEIRDPLPQLSLNIAQFEEKQIDIEGIKITLAHVRGHNYYSKYVSELNDTLSSLLLEFIDDFERPLGLFYPYQQFTLVEAPAQFVSLPHSWTSTLANVQPQIINFPEWGYNVTQADFASSERRIRRDSERNKEGLSEKEIQARVFANFLRSTFTSQDASMSFNSSMQTSSNPFNIFPNYFYFVNYITSDVCPVLNYAFESYLMQGSDNPRAMFMARITGIGENEQANLQLKERSLKQIISEETDRQIVNNVLKVKGSYLLTWMEKQVSGFDFNQYILDYLYNNSYVEIKYDNLVKSLNADQGVQIENILTDWYTINKLPAFGLGSVDVIETIDQSQAVFLVRTKVTNYNEVDGLVKFSFMLGEGRRGGGGGFMGGGFMMPEPEERIFLIEANQTKEIQIALNEMPRSLTFNTLLSENIPSSSMTFGLRSEKIDKVVTDEYEKVIDSPVVMRSPDELIVDNKDVGFSIIDPSMNNPLRQWVEQRKKKDNPSEFVGEGFGQAPSTWSLMANSDYFGEIEHSAMVIRSGNGSKYAVWKQKIPTPGYYDIYVYLNEQRRFGPGRGRGRGNSEPEGSYIYNIKHDDGNEEIAIEVKNFETGWNLLGSFYFSSDTSEVVLTDKGGADRIVADAVKWTLQR